MIENEDMDTDGAPGPPVRKTRRLPLLLKFIVVTAVLVGTAAFAIVQRSSSAEWYASPPIDSQGRRLHFLVPAGWNPSADSQESQWRWTKGFNGPEKTLVIRSDAGKQSGAWVQMWLRKLHLISPDEQSGEIVAIVGQDTIEVVAPSRQELIRVGEIQGVKSHLGEYMVRTIHVRGTDKQATIAYNRFATRPKTSSMLNTICRSMYVQ